MRERIPELKRRAIQKIIASCIRKGFIIERVRRSQLGKYVVIEHPKGKQIANAFELDFKRRFPRDAANPAVRLWKELVTKFREEHAGRTSPEKPCNPKFQCREGRTIDELLRPEYPVWFEMDEAIQREKLQKRIISHGLLCIHCESERAAKFCEVHLKFFVAIGETLSPPVHAFKFTFPKF